jgi:hypothetical protein
MEQVQLGTEGLSHFRSGGGYRGACVREINSGQDFFHVLTYTKRIPIGKRKACAYPLGKMASIAPFRRH